MIKMFKLFICILTILFPNMVKIFILNRMPGYKVSYTCHVGLSLISVDNLIMKDCSRIGHFNIIKNVQHFNMDEYAIIHNFNRIKSFLGMYMGRNSKLGSHNNISGDSQYTKGDSNFKIGELTTVTTHHIFDMTGSIIIGKNSVLAGIYTQLYTHSFDLNRDRIERDIIIGDNCYIGSNSIILANITSNVLIGAGSTVYNNISEGGLWSSHKLVRIGDVIPIKERQNLASYGKAGFIFHMLK